MKSRTIELRSFKPGAVSAPPDFSGWTMAHSSQYAPDKPASTHRGFELPASVSPSNSEPPPRAGPFGEGRPSQNSAGWAMEFGL